MFRLLISLVLAVVTGSVTAAELKDPTRPAYYQPKMEDAAVDQPNKESYLPLITGLDRNQYKLQGIIRTKSGKRAIVNGQRLRIGDEILDAKLVAIESGFVILEGDGDRLQFDLVPLTVKTSVQRTAGGDK